MPKSRPYRHLAHLAPYSAEPIVFFTAVTHDRKTLLASQFVHDCLHGLWQRSADRNGWYVGDYVLMPDHVHLFVRAARTADRMADWVKMWKSVSARELIGQHGIQGPVWQEDYFDRYLRSSESYSEKWEYVQTNPVRAGLVTKADEWPYRGRIWDLSY